MALTKYAIIRGAEVSIVSLDVDVGREDVAASELRSMNDAPDCVRIRDDAHEATLRNESTVIAGFIAEVEGMSIGAMTAAQQRKLLAIVCRRLGIRVRP